jgi:hypothetical protein
MEVVRSLPRFSASMTLEVKGHPATNFTFAEEPPKEIMDAYEQVAGNGLARVTVSTDMGIKDFGTGAGSMVTISLACNQDQQTMQTALNLAGQLGRWFVKENRQLAENELNVIIEQKKLEAANKPRY